MVAIRVNHSVLGAGHPFQRAAYLVIEISPVSSRLSRQSFGTIGRCARVNRFSPSVKLVSAGVLLLDQSPGVESRCSSTRPGDNVASPKHVPSPKEPWPWFWGPDFWVSSHAKAQAFCLDFKGISSRTLCLRHLQVPLILLLIHSDQFGPNWCSKPGHHLSRKFTAHHTMRVKRTRA